MEARLGLMKGREIEIRENERRRIWDPSRRKGLKGSNGMTRRRSLTSLGPPASQVASSTWLPWLIPVPTTTSSAVITIRSESIDETRRATRLDLASGLCIARQQLGRVVTEKQEFSQFMLDVTGGNGRVSGSELICT